MIFNVIITGIGGQGVVSAASLLRWAVLAEGYRLTGQDNRGGAQRLGHVAAVIRFTDEAERAMAPEVPVRDCHLLIAMEASEGLRFASAIGPGTTVVFASQLVVPTNQRRAGLPYLTLDECREQYKRLAGRVLEIDAEPLALKQFGRAVLANYLLLGAGLEICQWKQLNKIISGQIEGSGRDAIALGGKLARGGSS